MTEARAAQGRMRADVIGGRCIVRRNSKGEEDDAERLGSTLALAMGKLTAVKARLSGHHGKMPRSR
jgi:hypothetical protein